MKREFQYILCNGSGNRFVLIDAVAQAQQLLGVELSALARTVCAPEALATDGLLLLVRDAAGYAMRMFNTDGSEAEMCGNGIRCVARLAARYFPMQDFELQSGGRVYRLSKQIPIFEDIPTYSVEIPVTLQTDDFPRSETHPFLNQLIPELDETLLFTYINVGNPHLVACVEHLDIERLKLLGERVTTLKTLFPKGINVSFFRCDGAQSLFVATYERGVGLTSSCGTAMTASSSAACLLDKCSAGVSIDVRNRGGMVRCCCQQGEELVTALTGNATFEAFGQFDYLGALDGCVKLKNTEPQEDETAMYLRFVASVRC